MRPGEYTGADGQTYRWSRQSLDASTDNPLVGYTHEVQIRPTHGGWEQEWINAGDWPAAKAALDALIEAEAERWVYLTSDGEPVLRISLTGERVQQQDHAGRWTDYSAWWIKEAYRQGRELERAKCAKLREAGLEDYL